MSTFEWISVVEVGISAAAAAFLAVFLYPQLRAVRAQMQFAASADSQDHDRRRKQATLEFWVSMFERRNEIRSRLGGDLTKAQVDEILDEARANGLDATPRALAARDWLNLWESVCSGMKTDVFDFDAVYDLGGNSIIKAKNRFADFIIWMQELDSEHDDLFINVVEYGWRFERHRDELRRIAAAEKALAAREAEVN